jgi:hypothetical protein
MRDIDLDEAKEDGLYRGQRAYERAVTRRDPFYPPELHEQDQFRWHSTSAENAVIALTHNLARNHKMDLDKALQATIARYAYNPDNIPVWELDKLRNAVQKHLGTEEDACTPI